MEKIQKGYVVAAIMCTKYDILKEQFVKRNELEKVVKALEEEFKENSIDALFTEEIDASYFKILPGIIIPNYGSGVDMEAIRVRFQSYISFQALLPIWNKELIQNQLIIAKDQELVQLQFQQRTSKKKIKVK